MMKLSNLRLDPKSSVEGVWIDYIRGTRLLIARYDNREMSAFRRGKALEYAHLFNNVEENREEALEKSMEIDVEAVARFGLLDWEGFTDDEGNPEKYTPELGIEILSNDEYEEFRDFVYRVSQNNEIYRAQSEAAAAKAVKPTAAS